MGVRRVVSRESTRVRAGTARASAAGRRPGAPRFRVPWAQRRTQGAARPPGLSVLGVLSLPTVARVAEEPFPGEDEEKRFGHFYNIYFQPFFRADS